LFYPREAATLRREMDAFVAATPLGELGPGFPKALIAPHAGYVYSGPIAASAYALLAPARGIVRRVVLAGPCHRVPVHGIALPESRAFATPLGTIALDEEAIDRVRRLPGVTQSELAHADEHAIEVHLPFLQAALGEFTLVPLVVGDAEPSVVAAVLDAVWGGPETLVVISSDLSHYFDYRNACAIDAVTCRSIVGLDGRITHDQACGATPIAGLLRSATERALAPELLDCRNSGDTAGGRDRVVGYASFAFWERMRECYTEQHGRALLAHARASLMSLHGLEAPDLTRDEPWLRERRATFVTLREAGRLRGCIGSLEAERALVDDVTANARAAAARDPRFAPLPREALDGVEIEVSVLSRAAALRYRSAAELIAQLQVGQDGVILDANGARATFLPQVWEDLPQPREFLAELRAKSGLPTDYPLERCAVSRYRVRKWAESELGRLH
jgi:AmmeMemoRadiSam system protein B/AmmeMemoRadiSam system protein A